AQLGSRENTSLPLGSVRPAWGNPTPATIKTEMPVIPCIGISRIDGGYLLDQLANGPVRVRLNTQVENGWRELKMTIELPAAQDFVLIGGHQDGWYGEGAPDNAAGNACMLELARAFARHRDELVRGLVFSFWTAHETGTMVGSSWWVGSRPKSCRPVPTPPVAGGITRLSRLSTRSTGSGWPITSASTRPPLGALHRHRCSRSNSLVWPQSSRGASGSSPHWAARSGSTSSLRMPTRSRRRRGDWTAPQSSGMGCIARTRRGTIPRPSCSTAVSSA
ncbi:MAG: M28 family peptidase, partial [Hyphomicrobiaceae bacterium]|nr:M28 family peptidase [Hyphomicrobiaceae bacterium]